MDNQRWDNSGQWTLSTEKDESKKLYGELEVMHN
jgi:hypothetical protein